MVRVYYLACVLLGLLVALNTAAATASSDRPPPVRMDSRQLLGDADILQRSVEQLHPGLYRYNTPQQTSAHFAQLRQALRGNPTLAQAFLAFSRLAASIRCGHTSTNFYNQPDAIAERLYAGQNRLPFYFRWVSGSMVITHNFSDDAGLLVGSAVTSINGVTPRAMLRRLLPLIAADGANDGKRLSALEVAGRDRYEAFDILLPLLYPTIGSRLTLELRQPGRHALRRITVTALTQAERRKENPANGIDPSQPLWSLRFPDARYAVMDMPTWAVFNSRWDWRHFIESSFAELARRGTPNLVIDLRHNPGGESVIGNQLLAHLTATPVELPTFHALVRYRRVPEDLRAYLKTWDPTFKDWGTQAVPFDARFYRLTRAGDDADRAIQPRSPHFSGHVFVLVGAVDSSATFEFARQIRATGLATLIGQTTGGNRRGINGVAFFFLQLPYSHIEVDLPLIGQFAEATAPDAGLDPDVQVATQLSDIVHRRDAEMAAASALMR